MNNSFNQLFSNMSHRLMSINLTPSIDSLGLRGDLLIFGAKLEPLAGFGDMLAANVSMLLVRNGDPGGEPVLSSLREARRKNRP
jgi:hypothetical protein